MNIVVECPCQVAYEFEIEPQDGQMPTAVFCPSCGADGTAYANAVIQRTLEQNRLAADAIVTASEEEAAASPTEPAAVLEQTGESEQSPGLPKFCYLHPDRPMEGFCFHCHKPICQPCLQQFAFYCSAACRAHAPQSDSDAIPPASAESLDLSPRLVRSLKLTGVALVIFLGLWIWYEFWAKTPSVKFTLPLPGNQRLEHAQFTSDHELLLIYADALAAFDLAPQHETWTKSFASYRTARPRAHLPQPPDSQTDPSAPAATAADAAAQERAALEDYPERYDTRARVHLAGDLVWLTLHHDLVAFDRASGADKIVAKVDGQIQDVGFADNAVVVISTNRRATNILTRIELPSGQQQTELRAIPPPPPTVARSYDEGSSEEPTVLPEQHAVLAAGPTVACLDVKLLEKKLTTVEAMKAADPEKLKEVKVSQVGEYAEDVFNEMRRMKGGATITVDESRYAVTLQRVFSANAPPWAGEVVGPVRLFPLQTVDLLVAGKTLAAFDRHNRKLWQTTLSYPIAEQFSSNSGPDESDPERATAPCLEAGDTVYFFDQGVLTAFDLHTGTPRWRIPSVGVSRLQFDPRGMLYVRSTSANAESLKYRNEVHITDPIQTVFAKVNPVNGKTLWRAQKLGEDCHLTGRFVFTTEARGGSALLALTNPRHDGSNFRLCRLNPGTGKKLWEFVKEGSPSQVDFRGNQILFQFQNRLEVLRFFSF